MPDSTDETSAIAYTASMIRAVSVPMAPQETLDSTVDIWPTLWRVYADTKDMVYFYEDSLTPKLLWTTFADHDFTNGTVKQLELTYANWPDRVGDMKGKFIDAKVFQPLGAGK